MKKVVRIVFFRCKIRLQKCVTFERHTLTISLITPTINKSLDIKFQSNLNFNCLV